MSKRAREVVPAVVPAEAMPVPWERKSKGEKLSDNVDLSLDHTKALLSLPFDPENLKLVRIQTEAALTLISQQIRVEAEHLRDAPRHRASSLDDFYKG